jgi:hypothetical protein
VKNWIRIRMKVMQIRNPAAKKNEGIRKLPDQQCCGSGMFIPEPGSGSATLSGFFKSIHVRTLGRQDDQLTGRGGMLHNRGGRGAAPAGV